MQKDNFMRIHPELPILLHALHENTTFPFCLQLYLILALLAERNCYCLNVTSMMNDK